MKSYIANKDTVIPVGNRTHTYKEGQEFKADPEIYDIYIDLGILRAAPVAAPTEAVKVPEVEEPSEPEETDETTPEGVDKNPVSEEVEIDPEMEQAVAGDGVEVESEVEGTEDTSENDSMPQTMTELKGLKNEVLRDIATDLGLSTEGKKEELVARIADQIFED